MVNKLGERRFYAVLILVLLVGVIAFAGWRIIMINRADKITSFDECVNAGNPIMESYPAKCSANGKLHTQESAAYTDADNTYTITYPTTLNFTMPDTGTDQPSESKPIDAYTLVPFGTENQGMMVILDKSNLIAPPILANFQENGHTIEDKKINGYDAKYARVEFNGDAEQYVDHNYLVYNGDAVVYFNFREKYDHQTTGQKFDNTEFVDDFETAINSIRFNN